MIVWVLPGILDAEEVRYIAPQLLEMMASTSTAIIVDYVNKFIAKYKGSSDVICAEAADKLEAAYASVNAINEYLNGDEAKNLADTLAALQYSDISAELPTEKLLYYKSLILELLMEDADFAEQYKQGSSIQATGYKTAYTVKLDADNFNETLDAMRKFCTENPRYAGAGLMLVDKLNKQKNLFTNGRTKTNSATVLRKAIYHKDKLKSILRGIDFLLERRAENVSPRAWRML